MTDIRGLLFDKDGTLFDFMATWGQWTASLLDDLAAGSADLAGTLGQAVGYDRARGVFAPDSPVIAHTPAEIADALLPHLPGSSPMALVARMNALSAAADQVEAVPLVPLFRQFREMGLKIGLVTNDSEEPARAHLTRAGVTALFDYIAGSDSGHGAKPAPGPLLAFATRFGLEPAQVLMVGDSRHDLHAARAAGMQAVAVLTGIGTAEALAPEADVVLADIGLLGGWIDSLC